MMKKELFSPTADLFALLPVSAYETAWVAMIPDPDDPTSPMFPAYLDWILRSQNVLGFWFDDHVHEQQRGLDLGHNDHINYKHQWSGADLMATLACLIALKKWEITGFHHKINKGIKFLQDNMEEELVKIRKNKEGGDQAGLYKWFLMLELAKANGLKINNEQFVEFKLNGIKFKSEEDEIMERVILREIAFENYNISEPFRSPSTIACAFIITREEAYKTYLQHLATNCQDGVPPIYLVDKDVIKLCIVDHLERLGCVEHFTEEIRNVMDHQYGKWMLAESEFSTKDDAAFKIYKDSLAFRLLRMHGYQVSPRRFCWFINDKDMLSHMEHDYAFFLGPMLSIYKASHIAFLADHELDKAGVFAQQILQMGLLGMKSQHEINISATTTKFEQEVNQFIFMYIFLYFV